MPNPNSIRSMSQLMNAVKSDESLAKELQADPVKTIEGILSNQIPDTTVYKIVVSSLGAAVLMCIAGAILITLFLDGNSQIPDILVASASAAVGALAGLLAPQPG